MNESQEERFIDRLDQLIAVGERLATAVENVAANQAQTVDLLKREVARLQRDYPPRDPKDGPA